MSKQNIETGNLYPAFTQETPMHQEETFKKDSSSTTSPLLPQGPLFQAMNSTLLKTSTAEFCSALLDTDDIDLSFRHKTVSFNKVYQNNNSTTYDHVDLFSTLEFAIQNKLYPRLYRYYGAELGKTYPSDNEKANKLPQLLLMAAKMGEFDIIKDLARRFSLREGNEEQHKKFKIELTALMKEFISTSTLDEHQQQCLLLISQEFKLFNHFVKKTQSQALNQFRFQFCVAKLILDKLDIDMKVLFEHILRLEQSHLNALFNSLRSSEALRSNIIDTVFQQFSQVGLRDKTKDLRVILAIKYLRERVHWDRELQSADNKILEYTSFLLNNYPKALNLSNNYKEIHLREAKLFANEYSSVVRSRIVAKLDQYINDKTKWRNVHSSRAKSLKTELSTYSSLEKLIALLENQKELFYSDSKAIPSHSKDYSAHTKAVTLKNKDGRFFARLEEATKIAKDSLKSHPFSCY